MSRAANSWTEVTLGSICEFKYGKGLPEESRVGGKVPVFGSNGIIGFHNEALTSGPTIIIGRKGSFGEVNYSSMPCWPIDTTYYIDATSTKEDLRWLIYRLRALGLNKLNRAAAVPGLNREDVYRLRFSLPPRSEQRRIAAILDKAEELRIKRRASLQKLDELSQSIFLDMFGDPIVGKHAWTKKRLETLGTLDRGVSKHRPRNAPELLGGPYPFIQTGDIANCDGYIRKFSNTYSETGLRQSRMWPAGTLCITIAANIAKTGILTFDACFPDSVVGFTSDDKATTEYVRIWMSFLQASLEEKAPESAQKNINLEILRNLKVAVPRIELRREFAHKLSTIERVKCVQRASAMELDNLFASLQHGSFSGAI